MKYFHIFIRKKENFFEHQQRSYEPFAQDWLEKENRRESDARAHIKLRYSLERISSHVLSHTQIIASFLKHAILNQINGEMQHIFCVLNALKISLARFIIVHI